MQSQNTFPTFPFIVPLLACRWNTFHLFPNQAQLPAPVVHQALELESVVHLGKLRKHLARNQVPPVIVALIACASTCM